MRYLLQQTAATVKQKQRGVAAVEFAIVASIFFMLMFVIIDGARLIYAYSAVSHAAKSGVRYAVVRGEEAGQDQRRIGDAPITASRIKSHLQSRVNTLADFTVTAEFAKGSGNTNNTQAGQFIGVTIDHDFTPVSPFLPSVHLNSSSKTVIYF